MNDPIDHDGDESRLDKLEQDVSHLLRQAKTHELDLNQVKATLERVLFDTGSTRESLDSLERRYAEAIKRLRAIAEAQASHSEKLDTLGRGQQELQEKLGQSEEAFLEVLVKTIGDESREIKTMLADRSERMDQIVGEARQQSESRFDRIETTMATKDDIAGIKATQEQLLQLLQQKPGP